MICVIFIFVELQLKLNETKIKTMKNQLLLFLLCTLLQTCFAQGLTITEILYNPPEKGSDTLEYVRLTNLGVEPRDLNGFSFEGFTLKIDSILELFPGEHLYITENKQILDSLFTVESIQWTSGSLSNTGELLAIYDEGGQVVDSVRYSKSGDWPRITDQHQGSIYYCPGVELDNSKPENWYLSSNPIQWRGDTVHINEEEGCYQTLVDIETAQEEEVKVSIYGDFIVIQTDQPFQVKAYDLTGREIFFSYAIGEKILQKHLFHAEIILLNIQTLNDSIVKKIRL